MADDESNLNLELDIENLKTQILERKLQNKELEKNISEIERKQIRKNLPKSLFRLAIPTIAAIVGLGTIIVAALTYTKSVSDTANDRFYALLQQLTEYHEVTPDNAPTVAVLISRLDSEVLQPEIHLTNFLLRTETRGFEVAYVVIPFAKVFGEGRDITGEVAAGVLAKAISRVDDLAHRDRLVADWGNHINFIQGKDTSIRYLDSLGDVTCELDLLSERVGATTSDTLESCRQRMAGKS